MNLVLIKSGAPIVLIRRKDRAVYYDALAASDDGDIAPLLDLVIKRSRDSLRQIQRIRAAEAGVTEAVVRAREAAKKEYEAWRYAMLLLLAEIDRSAQRAREASGGAVEIRVREYDQVTADDFGALLNRDPSGNGWLALLRGIGPNGVRGELLLWIGFRSREIQQLGGVSGAGADIFVSESDPEKTHGPFRMLDERSAFPISEIAFDGDRYLVRERTSDGERAIRLGAAALGARIVEEFIGGYLTSVVTAATS
jgi:hypothetical protein